ncbi:hypothetical protein D3C72_2173190 [compost metagenome]
MNAPSFDRFSITVFSASSRALIEALAAPAEPTETVVTPRAAVLAEVMVTVMV